MRHCILIATVALGCGCVTPRREVAPPAATEQEAESEGADEVSLEVPVEGVEAPPEQGLVGRTGQRIGAGREWVSGSVATTADWIDGFFGSERHEAEVNQTQVRIRLDSFLEQDEDPDFKARAKLRISLPNTEGRLSLIVAGNPEDDLVADADPLDELELGLDEESDERAAFGAEYFLLDGLSSNVRLEGTVRVKDDDLVYRVGARYRQNIDLQPWLMRFTERLRWESLDGYDSRTTVDFDRILTEIFFLRATTVLKVDEVKEGLFYGQAFTVSQRLAKRKLLSYVWATDFRTEPDDVLEATRLRLRYRQPIFSEWVYFEIAPEVRFREVDDYAATYALLLRLDLFFGGGAYRR